MAIGVISRADLLKMSPEDRRRQMRLEAAGRKLKKEKASAANKAKGKSGTHKKSRRYAKGGKVKAKNLLGKLPYPGWEPGDPVPPMKGKKPIRKMPPGWKIGDPVPPMKATPARKKKAHGGKVGSSIRTYSSGGYVEGE